MMAYMGRLLAIGVPFFSLRLYNRVGISQVEVYGTVGKSVIKVLKGLLIKKISRIDERYGHTFFTKTERFLALIVGELCPM